MTMDVDEPDERVRGHSTGSAEMEVEEEAPPTPSVFATAKPAVAAAVGGGNDNPGGLRKRNGGSRQQQQQQQQQWRDDSASSDDERTPQRRSRGNDEGDRRSPNDRWALFYCDARQHVYVPYIVSGYVQLGFNMLVIAFVCYLGYTVVASVQHDVDVKVADYSADVVAEMATCAKHFQENRCSPDTVIPAMKATCTTWRLCMDRDPTAVARTRLSAQTIGEIINSFVEPLSFKTVAFITLFFFVFIVSSNMAFQFTRSRLLPPPHAMPPPPAYTPLSHPPPAAAVAGGDRGLNLRRARSRSPRSGGRGRGDAGGRSRRRPYSDDGESDS